jgi:arginine:pyruvate transaminase
MTAAAVSAPSPVAAGMVERFARRARLLRDRLHGVNALAVHVPQAGMFAMVDVRATGLSGVDFAQGLLDRRGVAVMPGESFGTAAAGWLRLTLTQPDEVTARAADLIAEHAREVAG